MSSDRREPNIEAIWSAQDALPLVKGFAVLLVALGIPVGVGYFYFAGPDFRNAFGFWMAVVGCISLYHVIRNDVRRAISLIIWCFWALLIGWCFLVFGIRTPVLVGMPAFIMLTGWLLGKRSAVLMSLMTLFALGLLFLFESSGWLRMIQRQANDYYISYGLVVMMSGYLAGFFGKSFRKQFDSLQETRQSLQIQLEALRYSEERFSLLFRTSPSPLMMTRTSDGTIYEVNEAWEKAFGWQASEVRGKTTLEIKFWPSPEVRARALEAITQHGGTFSTMRDFVARDGNVRSYLHTVVRIEVEGELRTVASLLDQTERLQMEEAMKTLNASLESQVVARTVALSQALDTLKNAQAELLQSEKLASLGSLVAGISHELNTPIGNALTVASTLQEKAKQFNRLTNEGQLKKSSLLDFLNSAEEMCDLLYRSCKRSSDLVHSFKQIAVDQTTEHRRQFDLRTLVDDVLVTLRPSFKMPAWQVNVEVPEGIECDSYPGPLVQVLTNLIQNAFIHAFDGRESGEVLVAAHLNIKGMVRLTVRDNGNGMDAATKKRIFDPFFTTRMGRGGTGLGLSISHQIATAVLGGSLKVTSKLGHGSTFILSFPANRKDIQA
ncbi:MAG: hypothetical protein H6R18_262 [Proteobacteria bacterium]|nr:hypothetical protein [Pseudomonadota bacterium]